MKDFQENHHPAIKLEPGKKAFITVDAGFASKELNERSAELGWDTYCAGVHGVAPDTIFSEFVLSEDKKSVLECPEGHAPSSCSFNNGMITARFTDKCCESCPNRERCGAVTTGKKPNTGSSSVKVSESKTAAALCVSMREGQEGEEALELIPYVVATRFLQILKNHPSKMFRADAKAQVSFVYDSGKITTFLCSAQHSPDVEPGDFRHIIAGIMVLAATENGLNTDFEKLVNPTGRFVIGGPYADCGVTGRKLACDTYGGIGRIGGGAMSGKDPSKVDRSGACMARKIARDIVRAGYAEKCEVQIAYAIGVVQPVSVYVETFGTEYQDKTFLEQYVRDTYDLTPRGIINSLGLLDVDYNKVSAYRHFGKEDLPREQ